MPLEEWHRMLAVNLTGVFLCIKHELAQMVTQDVLGTGRGAICNTSSGAAVVPAPGQPHYTAAKHGVVGMMKNVAQEYAGYDEQISRERTMKIYDTIYEIADRAQKAMAPTYRIADTLVEERLAQIEV